MTKKSKGIQKKPSIAWKILISTFGILMITTSLIHISLYFWGETAAASVSTRRIGGASDGRSADQRYEWSIDYTFMDQKGIVQSGHSTNYGSDFSVNVDRVVYYYEFAPFLNAMESEVKPSIGQLILVILGILLIKIMME